MNRNLLAGLIAAVVLLAAAGTALINDTRAGITYLIGCGMGLTVSAIVREMRS